MLVSRAYGQTTHQVQGMFNAKNVIYDSIASYRPISCVAQVRRNLLTYEPAPERALADDHAGVLGPGYDGDHGRRRHDEVSCTIS